MALIKSTQHKTIKDLPKEVKNFFNEILLEHIKEIGEGQFIDKLNISVSMLRDIATIETSSMDFKYDPKKGIEQFI